MGFNLPHKANVGEIVRVKGYEGTLFLVMEYTEEIAHENDGSIEETVSYTCRDIDNHKNVKIIFDQDIASIAVTADKSDAFIAERQSGAQPPAVQQKKPHNTEKLQMDLAAMLQHFEEAKKKKQQEQASGKTNENNKPRSPWAKDREDKRKAYEYIDFLLERYGDLISMQQAMPHDESIQAEIDLVKAEFMEKTSEKVIQDGKFS